MARILISSKVVNETLKHLTKGKNKEYYDVEVDGNQLIIWEAMFLICKSGKDNSDFKGQITSKSILNLIKVCRLIEDQPIVIVLNENYSSIGLDNLLM